MIQREISTFLHAWKQKHTRKPLILRGARQVGKSTVVRQLGETYQLIIELNMERDAHKKLMEQYDEPKKVLQLLQLEYDIKDLSKTLLFIDEIQASPKTIKLLRYLYEDLPKLHVIAAGSLLEFAMQEVASFPVGRVEQVVMHPINFTEYVKTRGTASLYTHLTTVPINEVAEAKLYKLYQEYTVIGGMPEAVWHFIRYQDVQQVKEIHEQLWLAYKDDIEKYNVGRSEREVLRFIMGNAHVSDDRIKFEGFAASNYKSREIGAAFRTLEKARIINLMYPATTLKPPLNEDIKKRPRIQFLDIGLLNSSLNNYTELLTSKDVQATFKGKIAQQLVTQQVVSAQNNPSYKPLFWVREQANTNAELDLVVAHKDCIIPIEIKAGASGTLRSLHYFMDNVNHKYAIRIYSGSFFVEDAITPAGKKYILMHVPLFLASQLSTYIHHLTTHY
jgi:uncharacterized protein